MKKAISLFMLICFLALARIDAGMAKESDWAVHDFLSASTSGPRNSADLDGAVNNAAAGPNLQVAATDKKKSSASDKKKVKENIPADKKTGAGTSTAPVSPALMTPADAATLEDGNIGFTWKGASGTSSYRLQVSSNPSFTPTAINDTTASISYYTRAELAPGTYYWRVKASKKGKWSRVWSFTVPPEGPLNTTEDHFINKGAASTPSAAVSLVISATSKKGIAAYSVSESATAPEASASTWVPVTPSTSFSSDILYTLSSGEGRKMVSVWFKDTAGNVSPEKSDTIILDTASANTTITSQPANPTTATSADFTFVSRETSTSFQCSLDNGTYAACSSPKSYLGLKAGPHTFTVTATDAEGPPARYIWTISAPPLDITITSQPSNPPSPTTASFSFTSVKAGATFQCQLDAGHYSACASPVTYFGLADGSHTLSVKASNALGNLDSAPASYTWVVSLPLKNTTPPSFINKGGSYYITKNPVLLSISASVSSGENIVGYYASESPVAPNADNEDWVAVTPTKLFSEKVPFTLSGDNGKRKVYVWFKDSAGNISTVASDTIVLFSSNYVMIIFLILQLALIIG